MALRVAVLLLLSGGCVAALSGCSGNWVWQSGGSGEVRPEPAGVNAAQWRAERGEEPTPARTPAQPVGAAAQWTSGQPAPEPERALTMGEPASDDRASAEAALAAALGRPTRDRAGAGPMEDGPDGLRRVSFADEGSDFNPRVSRDGKFMVFASTQHRPTADLYLKTIDGRTVTQLTAHPGNDIMPALSPDGARVAFASDRSGRWQLYVMSTGGGQAVQLTESAGVGAHDLHPTWSPDGKRLAFCRLGARSGRWEIWALSPEQPAAAEFIGYGMFPEWCPTPGTGAGGSDRLLFQRGRERGERAYSLWTIDYKPGWAGNPTEIVSGRDFAAINGTWSPDGRWIAYAAVPLANERAMLALGDPIGDSGGGWARSVARAAAAAEDRTELWLTSIDGSARVNLTGGRWVNVMPAWGPGNRVYFVSNRGGVDNVWSLSTERALAGANANGSPAAPSARVEPVGTNPATPVAPASEPGVATVPTGE